MVEWKCKVKSERGRRKWQMELAKRAVLEAFLLEANS